MTSTPNKKILVVSTSFPMSRGDGLSPFIWEYCLRLSGRGWHVTVLVPHHKSLKDEEIWDGVTIRRFRYLPERFEDMAYTGGIMPNIKRRPWRVIKLPLYIYAMYREALKIVRNDKFNLVNFHWLFPSSFWLGRFVKVSGLPVVMTGHGTDIHLASKGIFKKFADSALARASALTINSNYMKSILQNNILPPRVEIIPMGVDTEKFRPLNKLPSQSKTILYVGRLIKQKGMDLLVAAFVDVIRSVPDARLQIIGYGPERANIENIISSHHFEHAVKIIDMVGHDDLPVIYNNSRILVLPALIGEGLGMTPAEAGACGVPTVTFGLGGTSELVIDGQTGLIVKPQIATLRDGLLKLLQDDNLADELGRHARERVTSLFGWDAVIDKFDALFSEIIYEK
jgi:glycosyltransferase involved in cell wall biosynthesis